MSSKIVVTRHPALLEYLIKYNHVPEDVEHLPYADAEDVIGKHVYGILPLWLAKHCDKLTEVQLRLTRDKRGKELSLKDMEIFVKSPLKTYKIKEIKG